MYVRNQRFSTSNVNEEFDYGTVIHTKIFLFEQKKNSAFQLDFWMKISFVSMKWKSQLENLIEKCSIVAKKWTLN